MITIAMRDQGRQRWCFVLDIMNLLSNRLMGDIKRLIVWAAAAAVVETNRRNARPFYQHIGIEHTWGYKGELAGIGCGPGRR